ETKRSSISPFMFSLFLCALLIGSVVQARVTFKLSEVLQENDLGEEKRASFKCDNGCKAYTDSRANNMYITEYSGQTEQYSIVVNFANMGGEESSTRDPYLLPASTNYFIENRGEQNPKFVFYVVDITAPNIGTPVIVINDESGKDINASARLVTVLSGKHDAVRYSQLRNRLEIAYPQIYSTGFDSAEEQGCSPLFRPPSSFTGNNDRSVITVFSPISTVDFGDNSIGQHYAHVQSSKSGLISQSARSSTVYSSPGYVGCTTTNGQSYFSSITEIRDAFTLQANAFDITATYTQVAKEETVLVQVNKANLDFHGSSSLHRHFGVYTPPQTFIVVIEWERKTKEARWVLQMDFETYDDPIEAPATNIGRVRFSNSEVLQESALVSIDNADRAPFKCGNGCNAYTDSRANNLYITKYDAQKNVYTSIVNFSNMGGANKNMPEPYKLGASTNYFIENRGEKDPKFVFYVVDGKAPNINTPVMVIDEDKDVVLSNDKSRLITILNSKYDAVQYTQFGGKQYPKNSPQIYATGFDAVDEKQCSALYQSRAFESGTQASITALSPISTVDFGYIGDPSVHVKPNRGEFSVPNAKSSAVYSSPGYVGCSNANGQYSSSMDEINDAFSVQANSLDVSTSFDKVTQDETVHLTVNDAIIDLYGSSVFTKHFEFNDPFQFDVAVQWNRNTSASSWAVQLDFAVVEPTSAPPSTTLKTDLTTSISTSCQIITSIPVSI
ncbi:hypothetical protein PMAYCL1PPCAC_32131, partial [Pristionchus mayeri]